MRRNHSLALLGTAIVLGAAPLSAQAHTQHQGAPPEKLGRVVFPTSCSAAAQPRFERAMALLHSFWWDQAQRAFDEVLQADPGCAMAHWGKAVSHLGNPFAAPPGREALQSALTAVERAKALNPPTQRERDYVAALARFLVDHERLDHRTRALAFEEAMREVNERYPDDPEAAIFFARTLVSNAAPADKTFERQKRAGAILTPLFEGRPDHPGLAHYLIHAYDAPPLAYMAAVAARKYGEIAPSVPHALHMPSHTFTRLGSWEESIRSNLASAEAARQHEEAQGMTTVSFDRAHAWDYLVYAYLQQGRDAEAREILEETRRRPAAPSIATDYAYAAIPARMALERARWSEAAALEVRPSPGFPAGEAITHFARGIGAARAGNLAAAQQEVEALARVRATLRERNDAYWSEIVEAQRLAVSAWIAHATGDADTAIRQLTQAAEIEARVDKHAVTPGPILPARELLGDLLLELKRPKDAHHAYMATLENEPNRARSVYGAAHTAELSGDRQAARKYYTEYLRLMQNAGPDRPEVQAARAFLARR